MTETEKKLKGEIVNSSQLAKTFGVTQKTVGRWIKSGMPIVEKGNDGNPNAYKIDTAIAIVWYCDSIGGSSQSESSSELKKAKLREEIDKLRTENLLKKNELAYVDEVIAFINDKFVRVRQTLKSVPNKTAPLVALETDIQKIKEIELEALRHALDQLALPIFEESHIQFDMEGTDEE